MANSVNLVDGNLPVSAVFPIDGIVVRMTTPLTVGGWRRLRSVGTGATAQVWMAESDDGTRVAIKIAGRSDGASLLADEAERLLFVESPHLPRVLDVGRMPERDPIHPSRSFVVLEWISGEAIEPRRVPQSSRAGIALAVARDVSAALRDLHLAGTAHGDVKPANIIIEQVDPDSWRARLVDFGLCDEAESELPKGGTVRYLAPEVFELGATGGGRARDLYALGAVLAEIVEPSLAEARDLNAILSGALPAWIEGLIKPLLSPNPAARPSAAWAYRTALRLGAGGRDHEFDVEARRAAIRRSYLAVRREEVLRAARHADSRVDVAGAPGEWLRAALCISQKTAALRGQLRPTPGTPIGELGTLGRSRWLVRLIGPEAACWPPTAGSDAELSARLDAAVAHHEPGSIVLSDIQNSVRLPRAAKHRTPVELALALSRVPVEPGTLDDAEASVVSGRADPALTLLLARALRLRGEGARALAVLRYLRSYRARVEEAELLRRAGSVDTARSLLEIQPDEGEADVLAKRAAILARIELDRGHVEEARGLLDAADESPATLEVRALIELHCSSLDAAAATVEKALALPLDDEERARVSNVKGMIAHARGDHEAACEAFVAAGEHAARAGAVLEEATYRTGEAAAAAGTGRVGQALGAAERAELLFEYLGRLQEAGRAALTRAVVFSQLGVVTEAREAAATAIGRARQVGDSRCRGYVHLALCDALPKDDPEALDHAQRASSLLSPPNEADELRILARLHSCGVSVDVARCDGAATAEGLSSDSRLDWWRARAERAVQCGPEAQDHQVASALAAWASRPAPPAVRGPALAAGAQLAALLGQGELARRLLVAAAQDARDLVERAPAALRSSLSASGWIRALQAPRLESWAPEQLSAVENLLRALGRRDRLRPLLDQVLDALVLWTGVERGLLLLRAPGGKLTPRAARNLARVDLDGPQRELSYSLAERALAQGETIVAVDAAGELPDMHESVHALQLRSVLAVPLMARGEALGVVYLDDRVRRGAFGARELSWVRLVASLAAVAIVDARDQLLLRRAARRAERAEARVETALARREAELERAERELARERHSRETRFSYEHIVGQSEPLRAMLRIVDRVTTADVPVLLLGESGSGKELVARAIHDNGPRREQPFVSENCGAIPETLLESALFGHVRGAFTGASRPRAGLFEVADRGTLFLDEIAEMSLGMQTRLLRVLEEGTFRPVGAERERQVDVRVIGATHRDLGQMVKQGRFREDLFYRLDVISVRVPPLRERTGDVLLLARHFVERNAGGRVMKLSRAASELLEGFSWPGNVRQLENEIRRALVLADEVIQPEHFSAALRESGEEPQAVHGLNVRLRVDALERELVKNALARTSGNQTRAAELLGLSRFGLQKMIKRLCLSVTESGRRKSDPLSRAR